MRPISVPEFTLGWELEACQKACDTPEEVDVHEDGSVNGDGIEYVIKKEHISNIPLSLATLKTICADPDLVVDKSCGFHVHMGLPTKSARSAAWAGWYHTLARMLEKEAFDAVPESRRTNQYCKSLKTDDRPITTKRYWAQKYSNPDRYEWVNVVEMFRRYGIRTVEVRLMGNTHRYTYLLAWVAVCRQMAKSAWILTYDATALELELKTLRFMFDKIKVCLLPSQGNGENRVLVSNKLAMMAGLIQTPARIRTMETLIEVEENVRWAMEMEEREERGRANRTRMAEAHRRVLEVITFEIAALSYINEENSECRYNSSRDSEWVINIHRDSLINRHAPAVDADETGCINDGCYYCHRELIPTRPLEVVTQLDSVACVNPCPETHDTDCLICGGTYYNHFGHRCDNATLNSRIGSFPTGGN